MAPPSHVENIAYALPSPPHITPPPNIIHARDYTPGADKLSIAQTWIGREKAWDLIYFPLWEEPRTCANKCLWGGAETVDNFLLCQNDKECACKSDKLSTGVVWASKCVLARCGGDVTGAQYAQTLVLEFCRNAWRETGGKENDSFVVPRTGSFVDSIVVSTQNGRPDLVSSTSAPASNSGASQTSSSPNPSQINDDDSGDPNIGLKAGLGGGLGAFALIALIFSIFLIRRLRSRKGQGATGEIASPRVEVEGSVPWQHPEPTPMSPMSPQSSSGRSPMSPVEMPVSHGWGEIPAATKDEKLHFAG